MADKKYDNLARKTDFQENDPFAELTRIIGFEKSASAPAEPAEDFDIDLEKEMIGEFESFSLGHANDPGAADAAGFAEEPAPAFTAAPAVDDADAPADGGESAQDMDFDLGAALDAELSREADGWAVTEAAPSDEPIFGGVEASEQGYESAVESAAYSDAPEIDFALEDLTGTAPEAATEPAFEPEAFEEQPVDLSASDLSPADDRAAPADHFEGLDAEFAALLDQEDRAGAQPEADALEPLDDGLAFELARSQEFDEPAGDPMPEWEAQDPASIDAAVAPEDLPAGPSWLQSLRGRIEAGVNEPVFEPAADEVEPDQAAFEAAAGAFEPEPLIEPAGFDLAESEPVDDETLEAFDRNFAALLNEDGSGEPEPAAPQETSEARPAADPFAELAAMAAAPVAASAIFTRATPTLSDYQWRRPMPGAEAEAAAETEATAPDAFDAGADDAGPDWALAEAEAVEEAPLGAEISFDAADFDDLGADMAETDQPADGMENAHFDTAGAEHEDVVQAPETAAAAEPEMADSSADEDVPDFEVVEIVEEPVLVADDLELSEVAYQEPASAPQPYDDLEHELGALFGEQSFEEPAAGQASAYMRPEDELRHAVESAFTEDDFSSEPEDETLQPPHASPYATTAVAAAGIGAAAYAAGTAGYARPAATVGDAGPVPEAARGQTAGQEEDFDFESAFEETAIAEDRAAARPHRRRGLLIAGLLAGVAVIGGIGAYAFSFGGSSETPALVKAEDGPVKVRPENPGGTTVPNQDNQVYERVSSGPTVDAPAQDRLVTTTEEPVDPAETVAPPPAIASEATAPDADGEAEPGMQAATSEDGDALPMSDFTIPMKNEDRVAATEPEAGASSEDTALVTPRRVRTMVVRPDGSMVPREEPAPAAEPQAPQAGTAVPQLIPTDKPLPGTGADPIAATAGDAARPAVTPRVVETAPVVAGAQPAAPMEQPAEAAGTAGGQADALPQAAAASEQPATAEIEAPATAEIRTPDRVPVAPGRPADQPVDIVGEVGRNQQVASVDPQAGESPTAVPASEWSVQIASQPTADGAQATYVDLARRYGEVIGGRGVNIVKADIAGKGTFYRVRIPAASRSDANTICARYKTAGGSCFVSR